MSKLFIGFLKLLSRSILQNSFKYLDSAWNWSESLLLIIVNNCCVMQFLETINCLRTKKLMISIFFHEFQQVVVISQNNYFNQKNAEDGDISNFTVTLFHCIMFKPIFGETLIRSGCLLGNNRMDWNIPVFPKLFYSEAPA